MNTIKPIFIISLPRSGSTLLQKILMSHKDIASHAEPWFLLPLIYGTKKETIKTDYGQKQAVKAIENICNSLPRGKNDYDEEIKNMSLGIYSKLAAGKIYFLDKTPRYYFILEDLHRIFPNAKFIYLFRNPTSVFASMIEAFNTNKARRLDHFNRDLYIGPKEIARHYIKNKDSSFMISYEDLIKRPEIKLREMCDYLNVEYDKNMIGDFFNQQVNGHGDALGARKYKSLKDNTNKWKKIINSHYRKKRLFDFIDNVDSQYLDIGGYDRFSIKNEIKELETHFSLKENIYGIEEFIIRNIKKVANYTTMN